MQAILRLRLLFFIASVFCPFFSKSRSEDTIFSGVLSLVNSGNTPIAIIVFYCQCFLSLFFKI
uniref:paraquat-inducible protein A n=1 Tax=Shigella sp. FC1967 TaxID=1898041 RepID=UPI00149374B1